MKINVLVPKGLSQTETLCLRHSFNSEAFAFGLLELEIPSLYIQEPYSEYNTTTLIM